MATRQPTEDDIRGWARKYKVPEELAVAVFQQESQGGKLTQTSSKGAMGSMQVTPIAVKDVGAPASDINDPMKSAEIGVKYLAKAWQKTGTYEGAAAYYQAGPQWAQKIQQNPNVGDGISTTRGYAANVGKTARSLAQPTEEASNAPIRPSNAPATGNTSPSLGNSTPLVPSPVIVASSGSIANDATQEDASTTPPDVSLGQQEPPAPTIPYFTAGADYQPPAPDQSFTNQVANMDIPINEEAPPDGGGGDEAETGQSPSDEYSAPQASYGSPTVVTPSPQQQLEAQAGDIAKNLVPTSQAYSATTKGNLEQVKQSILREGDLKATVELEKYRQEQDKANENATELSRLGINLSDADSIVAQASLQMAADYRQAAAYRDEINAKKSVSFLDDPAAYLVNQFTLPQEIDEHNKLIDRIDMNRNYVIRAQQVATAAATANATKYAPTTAQGAKAAADIQLEIAKQNALKTDDQLNKVDLDTQLRTLTAIRSTTEMYAALDQKELTGELKRSALEQRDAKEKMQQLDEQGIQQASRILGFVDAQGNPTIQTRAQLEKTSKTTQLSIKKMLEGDGNLVANSPLEAQELLATGNPAKMAPALAMETKMLNAFRQQAEANVDKDATMKTASKEQRREAVNKGMQAGIANYRANPSQSMGSQFDTSPFQRPAPQIMEQDPVAAKLAITKLIQDHMKVLPNVPVTDTLIPQLALAAVGTATYPTIEDAARDVTKYYQAAIARNNNIYRFDELGIAPQGNYNVHGIDLTSYPAMMKYMMGQVAQQRFDLLPSEQQGGASGVFLGPSANLGSSAPK